MLARPVRKALLDLRELRAIRGRLDLRAQLVLLRQR